MQFEFNQNPGRVVFGSGSIQKLPQELERLSLKRPLLLSTPQQVDQVENLEKILNKANIHPAGIFSKA